jgi:hypothetical protein
MNGGDLAASAQTTRSGRRACAEVVGESARAGNHDASTVDYVADQASRHSASILRHLVHHTSDQR